MDVINDTQSHSSSPPASPGAARVAAPRSNPLDSDKSQLRLKKLMQFRRQARIAQAENRAEMAMDEDFYDGIQLTAEDLAILKQRNQPIVTYNVIANTLNWIQGTQRRAKIDSRVLPRKSRDAKSAKTKTKLMKYTQDCSKGEYEWGFAFSEMVKAGMGWMETGIRSNHDEPIFMRAERWRNMWYDHLGLSLDGSDWRFVIREKWIDLDIAIGMFPEREGALKQIADGVNSLYPYLPDDVVITDQASEFDLESEIDALFGGPFDGKRERLKMIEMWYRMPDAVQLLKMRGNDTPYGALDGAIYRPESPEHQYLVRGRYASLNDAIILTTRCAIWSAATLLQDELTPFNHNKFPFTPLICYRRQRDNAPYGVIRNLRDPQSDLNKRRSRSLFLLTANRIVADKGAVDDKVDAVNEANRSDGYIEVNPGKKFEIQKELNVASAHVEMARDDERFINNISGVTPELQGQPRNDLSGIAVKALQNQGQVTQGIFFDNYYYAIQTEGEIRLSLVEQFYDQEKEVRITGDQQRDEFITINQQLDDGVENDITQSKADFIVAKQDFRETIRQAMFQQLSDLVTNLSRTMPEVALKLLDMVVDYMDDLPNKDEMVERIRKINGQIGADDDMSPEKREELKKVLQSQEQAAAKQSAIQDALMQLELKTREADITVKNANAQKSQVEAMMRRLEGFIKAMEAAGTLARVPHLANAADGLIAESTQIPVSGSRQMTQAPEQVTQ